MTNSTDPTAMTDATASTTPPIDSTVAPTPAPEPATHVHHPDHAKTAVHATRLGATITAWQSQLLYLVGAQLKDGASLADAKRTAGGAFHELAESGTVDYTSDDISAFLARVSATAVLAR